MRSISAYFGASSTKKNERIAAWCYVCMLRCHLPVGGYKHTCAAAGLLYISPTHTYSNKYVGCIPHSSGDAWGRLRQGEHMKAI